jgi:hypothetical protein
MQHHSRTQRQLKNLAQRIFKEISSHGGQVTHKATRWMQKLRRSLMRIQGSMSAFEKRQLATALTLILGAAPSQAQTFAPAVSTPFGLVSSQNEGIDPIFGCSLVDLDDDGDYDMVGRMFGWSSIYEVHLGFHMNNGTPENAQFSAQEVDLFGTPELSGWDDWEIYNGMSIDAVDLDGDGDFDLITHAGYGYGDNDNEDSDENIDWESPVIFLENMGNSTQPVFTTIEVNPFGLDLSGIAAGINVNSGGLIASTFVDIDADGDFDLLGSFSASGNGGYAFFGCENIGSATSPLFASPTLAPFDLPASLANGFVLAVDCVDLDNDGDFDFTASLDFSDADPSFVYFENEGSNSLPTFGGLTPSPFGLNNGDSESYVFTLFSDIDGDGDFDAFHIDNDENYYYGPTEFLFQENTTPSQIAEITDNIISEGFIQPNALKIGGIARVQAPWDEARIVNFELIDLAGRIIQSGQQTNSFSLPTHNMLPGHYIIKLTHKQTGQICSSRMLIGN